jgi:transposase
MKCAENPVEKRPTSDQNDPMSVSSLLQSLQDKEEKIQTLQQQLDWFKRQLFGQKSEKTHDMADNPYQHTILELLEDLPEIPPAPNTDKETISYQRGKAKKNGLDGSPDDSGLRFDEGVPVEEIILSVPELEGPDADDYTIISYKTTYRLAQRPGSQVVLKYTRPVVKKKSTQQIITTAAPTNVLDKSFADVSFLVGMLTDKFLYHQPLHRQHQRLAQNGIIIARSTLTGLTQRSIELLKPIYQAQLDNLLLSRVLAMDETPIKAGRKKKGKMNQAYFWPLYGDQDEVCFTFSPSRGMQHLHDQLDGFSGTLLTDGYSAYAAYQKKNPHLVHAQCWAHSRRYFEKAAQYEPENSAIALAYIGKLYTHETHCREKGLKGEAKQTWRRDNSKAIVDVFFSWCYKQRQRMDLTPNNPITKALAYVMNRQHELRVFLSDPEVQIDTNHLERALRVIPMGKKNWLFAWTETGAEHIGIIQSLLVTCKLHDVNPYEYLVDVLQRVSSHPASRVEELTPRVWKEKFASNPMHSDLETFAQKRLCP